MRLAPRGSLSCALVARRILLVEPQAHLDHGHYPVIFAERAADLIELGYEVEVLTRQGWALAGDPAFPALTIHRFGTFALATDRFAQRLWRVGTRAFGHRLASIGRSAVIVLAARAWRRKIGATAVVVFHPCDERVASLLAGPGSWYLNQSGQPRTIRGPSVRLANWAARRAEVRRERRGGRLRGSYTTEGALESWQRDLFWFAPHILPLATYRDRPQMTAAPARAEVGLPDRGRLALFFGFHAAKDPDVIFQAFSHLSEWQLVVAGSGAAPAYRKWEELRRGDRVPILIEGFADEATRALLHSAVDLMVLSYQPSWQGFDSGGLMDALAWGLPVVCSDGCQAARIIRAHNLGTVFEPGNVDTLVAAVRAAPQSPDPVGRAHARSEMSGRRVAQRILDSLDL